MEVRNKVWEKIKEADIFFRAARNYVSLQRKIHFVYKFAIPVLAALCVMFTDLEMPRYTLWSAIFIFISSILKAFFTQIILSEKDLERLDKLEHELEKFRDKYEELMNELDEERITKDKLLEELEKRNSRFSSMETELNQLILWIPFGVKNCLQKQSEDYLQRVHYNRYS